ncbi:MAG TPA: glycosyltransferase family 2 protein [Chloroflexota bacterium]
MASRPDLSVVTVSHNSRDLLRACLLSLGSSSAVIEVLVVDSGSIDGTAELVGREFPSVRLLATAQNLGFTRGNNRALRIARGRHLLLLNPDTVVEPGALDAMLGFLEARPDVGVVGPQLRSPDGIVQPSRHRFPGRLTAFVDGTVLERWFGRSRLLDAFYARDRGDDELQDVDWLRGACLMVRREAAASAGLFDERFFMYSEEVDLCRRIRAAGWRVVYLPSAVVVHHEGRSSEQNLAARDIHFHDSRVRYYQKHFGRPLAIALRLAVAAHFLFLAAEEAGKLLLGHRPELRRQRLRNLGRVIAHQARRLVAA